MKARTTNYNFSRHKFCLHLRERVASSWLTENSKNVKWFEMNERTLNNDVNNFFKIVMSYSTTYLSSYIKTIFFFCLLTLKMYKKMWRDQGMYFFFHLNKYLYKLFQFSELSPNHGMWNSVHIVCTWLSMHGREKESSNFFIPL
jgi:hypothetical protein